MLRTPVSATTLEHCPRDIAEIKLFFNELAEPEDIARLAHDQVKQHEERIAEYEEMKQRFGGNPDVASRMITLGLGLEMEHAALRFWQRLAEHPPV